MTTPPPSPERGSPAENAAAPVDEGASPVGEAFAWASRIIAIGLAMFLPGVAGTWFDAKLGTRFLGPAGLVLGLTSALVWIVRLGNSVKPYQRRPRRPPASNGGGNGRAGSGQ